MPNFLNLLVGDDIIVSAHDAWWLFCAPLVRKFCTVKISTPFVEVCDVSW